MADSYNMSDCFLSYSRRDTAFCQRVFRALKDQGKEVWADFEDIPKSADWWAEIEAGINAADAFVFVISPDSVRSEVCRQEIDHAVAQNKRVIPLLHREITADEDKAKIHPTISTHNWLFFRETDDFDEAFTTLLETLETDLDYNRAHTRLLVRAREWDDNQRNHSYLLVGEDLRSADGWYAASFNKTPPPTTLHSEYIRASREAATQRQRRRVTLMAMGLVLSLALALFAAYQANAALRAQAEAEQARNAAEAAQEAAEESATIAQGISLAAGSTTALVNNDPDLALSLALLAEEKVRIPQTTGALVAAAYGPGSHQRIDVGNFVYATAFSPDGQWAASGLMDGTLCLWRVADGSQIHCIAEDAEDEEREGPDSNDDAALVGHSAHGDLISHLSFLPGQRLISASEDGVIAMWDVNPDAPTFAQALQYQDVASPVHALAVDPQAERVYYGGDGGLIGVWDIAEDRLDTSFPTLHEGPVLALDISRSGLRLVSGGDDEQVIHWRLATREPLMRFNAHAGQVLSIAFSHNGRYVASGDRQGRILIHDLLNGTRPYEFDDHDGGVTGLIFSPDDRFLFSASWDNTIREWNLSNERTISTYYGHTGGINTLSVDDGFNQLLTGAFDGNLRFWRLDRHLVRERIVTGGVIDRTRTTARDQDVVPAKVGVATALFVDNQQHVLTGQTDGSVNLYLAPDFELERRIGGYGAPVNAAAVHPRAPLIALAYEDGSLFLRDVQDRSWRWRIEIGNDALNDIVFTPDGAQLLLNFGRRLVWLDTESGAVSREWAWEGAAMMSFALSPDGEQALIGLDQARDNLVLVDVTAERVVRTFSGHTDSVLTVAFSPTGERALSGSFDNTVRLWDVATGELIRTFNGHSDRVNAVAFHPNAMLNLVLSGSNDRTVRLWNADNGFEVVRYRGHTDRVTAVGFNQTGLELVSASLDGLVYVWRLPHPNPVLREWVQENRYVRALTCQEKAFYMPGDDDAYIANSEYADC